MIVRRLWTAALVVAPLLALSTSCRAPEARGAGGDHGDAGLGAGGAVSADAAGPTASAGACTKLPDAAEGLRQGACAQGSDCSIVPRACCASCAPDAGASAGASRAACDFVAIPRASASAFARALGCADRPCDGCALVRPPELVPFCRAGACAVVDLRDDPITRCARDADCTTRDWACCTPCDAPVMPIAIRRDAMASFDDQLCSGSVGCDRCRGGLSGYRARCDAGSRRCVVDEN